MPDQRPTDEFAVLRGLLGDLRQDLTHLAGDIDTRFAKIEGALEVLAVTKAGEHSRLDGRIDSLRDDTQQLARSGKALHRRVDDLTGAGGRIAVTERKLDRVAWSAVGVGIGAGVTSGGVVVAVTRALGLA